MTTLLLSLPDGSPVQKTGVVPNLRLSLPAANEREASLPRAMGPWRGGLTCATWPGFAMFLGLTMADALVPAETQRCAARFVLLALLRQRRDELPG